MSENIHLDERWEFELDPDDKGGAEEWRREKSLAAVKVPGAWQAHRA